MKISIIKKLLPSVLLLTGFFLFGSGNAYAQFNAGRIIDDGVFTNKNSMSVSEIQNFLNSKVPSCDPWHAPGSGSQGEQPPWTCLKDFSENGKSAAQIIWEAGQTYGINPQVIMVTLQKENGLITDTWPYRWQYRTAMGMGCPDGAACDAQYFGFTNQVNQGTRHLAGFYNQNAGWYIPYRPGVSYIKWHPNAACGGTNVNIQNRATASLYSYTPYQPNGAALANMYGTGDGCSSYGNRNFWRDFTSWFGTTYVASYDYGFLNSSTAVMTLNPGQAVTYNTILIQNTGSATWYPDGYVPVGQRPTRLAMKGYQDNPFADTTDPAWLGTRNQIKMTDPQIPVPPGENARFTFRLTAPNQIMSNYVHRFVPVVDGITFMNDRSMQFVTSVVPPAYSYVSSTNPPQTMLPNQRFNASVTLKNNSSVPWYNDGNAPPGQRPMRLASLSYAPINYADLTDPAWLGTRNQIKMVQSVVNPGENATFNFRVLSPHNASSNYFRFLPVLDGVSFLDDKGMAFFMSTPSPNRNYEFVSATNPPPNMTPGSTATASITLKNTGNFVWRNDSSQQTAGALRLAMIAPLYRNSPFYSTSDSRWLAPNQITMTTSEVNPGENGTFTFEWKAPTNPGTYTERFSPVIDGVAFLKDIGMSFTVRVQ